ncbi:MAG: SGNH/GDSL hydrolase family protein [Burkholderiales bacterium]|nr:SGNH/GDSL hydrolase family protein [Burkholderiales bacterium]
MKYTYIKYIALSLTSQLLMGCVGDGDQTGIQNVVQQSNAPNETYDMVISPNGPNVSINELNKAKNNADHLASKIGDDTYTYVRCYYAKNHQAFLQMNQKDTDTSYVWAENNDGSYFKLNGYWHSDGIFALRNWFYINEKKEVIKKICDDTVKSQISKDNFSFYQVAANNQLSYNHTIWYNDERYIKDNKIDKIISFGDSLSDINNMYNMTNWLLPNNKSWFQGRFSNGYTWVEYLSQLMDIPLYNRAIGGSAGNTQKVIIQGLTEQVNLWIDYLPDAKNYNPQKTLATILVGGNDFITYNRSVTDLINDVDQSISNLAKHNVGHILILNLPDITKAPIFSISDKNKSAVYDKVIEYNKQLSQLITRLKTKYPNTEFKLFDTKLMLEDIIKDAKKYGFKNVSDSCLEIDSASVLQYIAPQSFREKCNNPSEFIFWDAMHITTKAHSVMANTIYQQYYN